MYRISVPISVQVSNKKKFYLNLNGYRNAHHFTLSKAKNVFHDIVAPLVLAQIPVMGKVYLTYRLFTGSEQMIDTNNVCTIVDKFFSDVLVSTGRIEDDNRHIVVGSEFHFGHVDKYDPRVEVTVTPVTQHPGCIRPDLQPKEEPMQITLIQTEIEDAIRNYVMAQVAIKEDQRIDIELRATRGADGYQAVIGIVAADAPTTDRHTVQVEPQPEPETLQVAEKVTKTRKAAVGVKKATPANTAANAPETTAEEQPMAESTDEPVETAEVADEAPVAETTNPTAAEAPAPVKTGLFASLGQPTNA